MQQLKAHARGLILLLICCLVLGVSPARSEDYVPPPPFRAGDRLMHSSQSALYKSKDDTGSPQITSYQLATVVIIEMDEAAKLPKHVIVSFPVAFRLYQVPAAVGNGNRPLLGRIESPLAGQTYDVKVTDGNASYARLDGEQVSEEELKELEGYRGPSLQHLLPERAMSIGDTFEIPEGLGSGVGQMDERIIENEASLKLVEASDPSGWHSHFELSGRVVAASAQSKDGEPDIRITYEGKVLATVDTNRVSRQMEARLEDPAGSNYLRRRSEIAIVRAGSTGG